MNLYAYAPNPTGCVDPLELWKGQPRKPNGTFGPGTNPAKRCPDAPDPTKKVHGHSRSSEAPATLYGRFDSSGNFEKWGISQEPTTRYSTKELAGSELVPYRTGPRSEMLDRERRLVERFPGPKNNEPWAGRKRKNRR